MAQCMLTTINNPYSPFDNFKEWYNFDETKGYHSSSLVALFTKTSDELSEADEELAIESAIDEIVELNPLGIHKKVTKEDYEEGGSMTIKRNIKIE